MKRPPPAIRRVGWIAIIGALGIARAEAAAADQPLKVCADPNNLPFSNAAGEGFENRIAALIADRLGRPLQFVWRAQRRGFLRDGLNAGDCDLVAGAPSANHMIGTTAPYYRSMYVFVTRPGEPAVSSFDDPTLRSRTIGVQLIGDSGANTPPAEALAKRGHIANVRGFSVYGDYRKQNPVTPIIDAVADGSIDVAAVWGPIAGYFASQRTPPLVVTRIEAGLTDLMPLMFDISMGVRKSEPELREKVQQALDDLKPRIKLVLEEFHVPVAER
jgi:mxaJ protein